MRTTIISAFTYLSVVSILMFTSCQENKEELPQELSIESKIELLQQGEWLLKGFETNVMHTFKEGKEYTHYGKDGVFGEAIPGTKKYTITGNLLTIDYNFGNIKTFEVKFSCNNTIVEFYEKGILNSTYYKKDSNYKDCLD